MRTASLSSKGQIIIPKLIRDNHQWIPGTKFIIEDTQDGILLKPTKFPPTRLEDGLGCVAYRGPKKSLDEISVAIDADVKKQWK